MIIETIKAFLYAGLPIAVISYYLSTYILKKTGADLKSLKKAKNQIEIPKDKKISFFEKVFLKKWMKFGGGFYGMVTFLTYIHIEIYEVIDFVKSFNDLDQASLKFNMGMVIGFFVDSIINFFYAFLWPIYWSGYLPIQSFWVWLLVAIACHVIANNWAYYKFKKNSSNER